MPGPPAWVIVATVPQLTGLNAGAGLAIVVVTVSVCDGEAADAKLNCEADSEIDPSGPGGPGFGGGLGRMVVPPPPQAARSSDALSIARRERRRKLIERVPLDPCAAL